MAKPNTEKCWEFQFLIGILFDSYQGRPPPRAGTGEVSIPYRYSIRLLHGVEGRDRLEEAEFQFLIGILFDSYHKYLCADSKYQK